MNILLLGRGKTGSLVAEVARHRGHAVEVFCSTDNQHACALTSDRLAAIDVIIDFTAPHAVVENIQAALSCKKNMVVGTTGWHQQLPRIRPMVEESGAGFLHGSNFSIGVNLFFDVARTAAMALQHRYSGQIFERHHAQKKDAPSGTAITLQHAVREAAGTELDITSFREGDVIGMHELVLDSPADTIYICHDAKSRIGFAEGAVRAAEWLVGKKGFFDFKDVWREI